MNKYRFKSTIAALLLIIPGAGVASEPTTQHNTNAFWFENWGGLSNATLIVVAPNGKRSEVFADAGTPVFYLTGRDVLDGFYGFELNAATKERVKIVNALNNGRGDKADTEQSKPFYMTGAFLVERGVIVTPKDMKEESN